MKPLSLSHFELRSLSIASVIRSAAPPWRGVGAGQVRGGPGRAGKYTVQGTLHLQVSKCLRASTQVTRCVGRCKLRHTCPDYTRDTYLW